jgi:hypothetical protein
MNLAELKIAIADMEQVMTEQGVTADEVPVRMLCNADEPQELEIVDAVPVRMDKEWKEGDAPILYILQGESNGDVPDFRVDDVRDYYPF